MWGKSKKKLQHLQTLIDEAHLGIRDAEVDLERINTETESLETETREISASLERERVEQSALICDNEAWEKDLARAQEDIENLDAQIRERREKVDLARHQKDELYKVLCAEEEAVKDEQDRAEQLAEAAIRESAEVRRMQDDDRRKWMEHRAAHDELQMRLKDRTELCARSKAERDAASGRLHDARDDYHSLELRLRRVREEHRLAQEQLSASKEKRGNLEKEIAHVGEQHAQVSEAHRDLEERFRMRKGALTTVAGDLGRKKVHIQSEIEEFQRRFQEAKEYRMNMTDCQSSVSQVTTPDVRRRELSSAGRTVEILMDGRDHCVLPALVSKANSRS